MQRDPATGMPTILFGAFDRHNFGDLLFPHIVAATLQDSKLIFAGLAERDLRCHGGHQVRPLAQLAASLGECPVNIIHVGGEILTCDAWQAAVMLLPPDQVQDTIARLESRPQERLQWARSMLGISALAPYVVTRTLFPRAVGVIYNAVGGVDLNQREPALRAEVLASLRAADEVSVRDRQTLAQLEAAAVPARLIPDPGVMVAELFGGKIRQRSREGEVSEILKAFAQGYLAVQFSGDFGDDETLAEIAAQLDQMTIASGYGVVLFRAGAAPWHDDLACFRQVARRMRAPSPRIFSSLDLWDICALIACSRAYCGSSLHGRIVAMAFALPRVNLQHPAQASQITKQAAYCATWESPGLPTTLGIQGISQGIAQALMADTEQLQHTAREMVAHCHQGFDAIRSLLKETGPANGGG